MSHLSAPWSKKEDRIVYQCVKSSPGNISDAFKNVSKLTGRTICAINYRWYAKLRKEKNVMSTSSKVVRIINGKNVKVKVQPTSILLELIEGSISSLRREERLALIKKLL